MEIKKELEHIYRMNLSTIKNLNENFCTVEEAKATTELINQGLEILKQLTQLP